MPEGGGDGWYHWEPSGGCTCSHQTAVFLRGCGQPEHRPSKPLPTTRLELELRIVRVNVGMLQPTSTKRSRLLRWRSDSCIQSQVDQGLAACERLDSCIILEILKGDSLAGRCSSSHTRSLCGQMMSGPGIHCMINRFQDTRDVASQLP